MSKHKPSVEYIAPDDKIIEQYARKVCQALGTDYTKGHITKHLAEFLKVLVRIQVKERNRRAQVDK